LNSSNQEKESWNYFFSD